MAGSTLFVYLHKLLGQRYGWERGRKGRALTAGRPREAGGIVATRAVDSSAELSPMTGEAEKRLWTGRLDRILAGKVDQLSHQTETLMQECFVSLSGSSSRANSSVNRAFGVSAPTVTLSQSPQVPSTPKTPVVTARDARRLTVDEGLDDDVVAVPSQYRLVADSKGKYITS